MSSNPSETLHNSRLSIIVVSSKQADLPAARRTLAREYRRIHTNVLPPYVEAVGGDGIGALAGELRMGLYEPYFPICVARMVAGRLVTKVHSWQKSPPSPLEIPAIVAFCDIDPRNRFDQPLQEVALGRIAARYMKIDPLEALIAEDDPDLLHLWHTLSYDSPDQAVAH